jgi:predicted dehydrogenase
MSHKDRIRVAVVGVGNMGRVHARDVHELANTELVAVCDVQPARADGVAAQYGVKAYYDYQDLLAEAGLQAILIATPHYDHTPISIACMPRTHAA